MKKITKIITVYDDGTTSTQEIYNAPNPLPTPWNTNNCPKCGLKLEGVMGYVCPQPLCPTGLGGIQC